MMENLIKEKWENRYALLSPELQKKIEQYDDSDEYLVLDKIKSTRKYPEIGDIFEVQVHGSRKFYGIVINNHISNIHGQNLLLVCIFKEGVNYEEILKRGIKEDDLLFSPEIVGKEYWTRGFFHNIGRYDNSITIEDYCFYSVGKNKIYDEYGNESEKKQIICSYSVASIFGIGILIGRELILNNE